MLQNFRRIMTAVRRGTIVGFQTAINSYNARDHVAEIEYDFTDYDARLARYWHNRRYADNTIYTSVNSYAATYKYNESLYKHIRGLYNPVGRLVQIEAAKVFGGAIDYETFATGALSINGADDALLKVIERVLRWSNFEQLKTLYVREGATMGDIALKIVDDVSREQVRIEVLDPRKVYEVQFDAVGNVKYIDIRYDRYDYDNQRWYEYREIIDKDMFYTFRDNEPYAYTSDADGNELSEWKNPYGFVPVEWTQHVNTSHGFGLTSFHYSRHKIDNLNDVMSLIHDNVRKNVLAKYQAKGKQKPELVTSTGKATTMKTTSDNRDESPVIYVGEDGSIEAIDPPDLDLAASLNVGITQQKEIESDLPQLALQRMRDDNSDLSGVAIENMYSDAVDVFGELQGNYNASTRSAIQMAISIAAFRRYDDFRMYTLDSYHSGKIDFNIVPRVLFQDRLSHKEKLEMTNLALTSKAPEFMLSQIGYSKDEIADVKREERQSMALSIRRNPLIPTTDVQNGNNGVNPNETAQQVPSDNQTPNDGTQVA